VERVGSITTVGVDRERAREGEAAVDRVGAAERAHVDRVHAGLAVGRAHVAAEAGDDAGAVDGDVVVALAAAGDHLVGHAVAGAVGALVDLGVLQLGAGGVVDDHDIGAAARVERDALDAADVEIDVGDVAEHAHARAVGGHVEVLADVRPVEREAVDARLAVDDLVAVTRVPRERVVAGAALLDVDAEGAGDGVIAAAADQRVGARAADQRVIAGGAVDRDRLVGDPADALQPHLVVTAAGVDVDRLELGPVEAEVDRAVGSDVGQQVPGQGGLEIQHELVARTVAGDRKPAVLHLAAVGGRGLVGAEADNRRGEAPRECRAPGDH
jgi:hypothetical protein